MAASHPVAVQACGDRRTVCVQFAVGERARPVGYGGTVGKGASGGGEDVDKGSPRRCDIGCGQRGKLSGRAQTQLRDVTARGADKGAQDGTHASCEIGDCRFVEERRGVLDAQSDARGASKLDELEGQVELGGAGVREDRFCTHAGEFGGDDRVAVLDHRLEHRVSAQCSFRGECRDDLVERHILRGEGRDVGLPDAAQHLEERRITGEVGAQRQGVDEHADQRLHGRRRPAGHRGTDHDVVARSRRVEHECHRGMRCHEHRRVECPDGRAEPAENVCVDDDLDLAANGIRLGWPRAVVGQVEFGGCIGELVSPVVELAVHK